MKRVHALFASVLALTAALPVAAADPELIVLDWAGFENPALIQDYIAKHGQMPTYSLFGDDDEAFQKVAAGFRADVAHPCSAKVQAYRDAGLIEPWDVSRIPEFVNIAPRFLASPVFKDETGVWYIPTDYAFTAIAWNTRELTEADVASLQVFHDPRFAGRVSLPDNTDDTWALAFLATGVTDWTDVSEEQIQAAAAWLRRAHQNVVAYWSDPSQLAQLMSSGQVLLAWTWNDTIALLRAEGFPVAFNRTPREGASNWFCGFVNLRNGPGSEDKAYDFINAWLSHGTARALLENFGYAHANDAAMATITLDEMKAADIDPIDGILLSQTPMDPAQRSRLLAEFERIKAGF